MQNVKVMSFKNIIVFLVIIGVIAFCFYSLDIIMMLFGAFIITCAINPLINKMEKCIPRIASVSIVLLFLIALCFVVFVPLIVTCIQQMNGLLSNIPDLFNSFDKVMDFKIFNKTLADLITFDSIKDNLAQGAQGIVENSIMAGKWIVNFITTFFAISIMVFYFAYDEKRIKDKFIDFFPQDKKQKALKILDNIASKVGNYIIAQGIAMIFVGLVTTLGLLILHNDHAFILGFITCVFDIIPVIGPTIAVLIGLITSVDGGVMYVLLTFVVYMIAQWTQNQFLRPIVFGKLLNMHPLIIIVALLVCARFLGLWGVILAPALACVICVLVDELYLNRINNKEG